MTMVSAQKSVVIERCRENLLRSRAGFRLIDARNITTPVKIEAEQRTPGWLWLVFRACPSGTRWSWRHPFSCSWGPVDLGNRCCPVGEADEWASRPGTNTVSPSYFQWNSEFHPAICPLPWGSSSRLATGSPVLKVKLTISLINK